jgi:nucleotide-binding universal stress UspA family protein
MTEIIVGVDGSPRGDDAAAFARRVAELTGARLALASAFPYEDFPPSRAADHDFREYLRESTMAMLDRTRATLNGGEVAVHAIADVSPARALHRLAEHLGASLVVVGPSHRGRLGRVLIGSTAERLLHGSPCPVAVVPSGYGSAQSGTIRTIGVGFDGSEESRSAVTAACAAARGFDADLRVIRVFDAASVGTPALMSGPGYNAAIRDLEQRAREGLDELVATLPGDVRAEAVFAAGGPAHELVAQSAETDLMLLGSRGYGPLAAVLLGGVSDAVLRNAACPVIVLPRGAGAGTGQLFASAAEAGAP